LLSVTQQNSGPKHTALFTDATAVTSYIMILMPKRFSRLAALAIVLCLLPHSLQSSEIVAQWNFNGLEQDANPATGTPWATLGSGSAMIVGSVSESYGTIGTSPDPGPDNSSWRIASFPLQYTANKSSGVEFRLNTDFFQNIRMTWNQRNSDSASRYWRVQCSTNGVDFFDHSVVVSTPNIWQTFSADFSLIPGSDNNFSFAVRLVSEYQSTASGSGAFGYPAANLNNNYGSSGTLWLDMITFTGDVSDPGNLRPTLTSLPNMTTRVDAATQPLAFTIGDTETAVEMLQLTALVDNPSLVDRVEYSGAAAGREIVVVPAAGQIGTAGITVVVTDESGQTAGTRFTLTVLPQFTPPSISPIAMITLPWASTPAPLAFVVNDLEDPASTVVVDIVSSNSTLFPSGSLVVVGTDAERRLLFPPLNRIAGSTHLTITATDLDGLSSRQTFVVKIAPPNIVAQWNYNSPASDESPGTGSLLVAEGLGSTLALRLGSVIYTDGTGSTDPNVSDNTDVRLGDFAPQGSSNKLVGVETRVSTVGYENIVVFWDQRNSNSASRYWRVQYTLNGGQEWVDGPVIEISGTDWERQVSASFTHVQRAANNPDFGIRLVAEFISTATGTGPASYAATRSTSNYSPSGTARFDMLSFHGEAILPLLNAAMALNSRDLLLSWSSEFSGFAVESSEMVNPPDWLPVEQPVENDGTTFTVTVPVGNEPRYFRLRRN